MDEQKLNEILTSYRDAINALIERMDAQDEMVKAVVEKVDGLDHLIFDEVINPAREAMDQSIYETGLNDFGNRYKDKLASYNEKLRPIEGEDFDIVKQAYDGYNSIEGEKPDEAVYVDELIKVVDKQLEDIRSAIGAPADAEVTVSNEDGETKVKVNGKEVSEKSVEEKPAESADESVEEAIEVSDSDEEETNPEELAALEKELLAYAK